MKHVALGMLVAGVAGLSAQSASAWGSTGHRVVTAEALRALPATVPTMLASAGMIADASECAREPDRWRLSGPVHDALRDPFHFAYADDAGQLGGGVTFSALPPTRAQYEARLRKAGIDPDTVRYLPYAIIDGWQQLAKDLVYWRADRAGLQHESDPAKRAWLDADRRRRESQIALDIGLLSHYVGDATQPMHLTVHHDGWGDYPNPEGYTSARVHVPYEGAYVAAAVHPADVRAAMPAPRSLERGVVAETGDWLAQQSGAWRDWYRAEKDGAFRPGEVRGVRYTAARLGLAAGMLRDLVAAAWTASATGQVNYPVVKVRDLESGRADAWAALHGVD